MREIFQINIYKKDLHEDVEFVVVPTGFKFIVDSYLLVIGNIEGMNVESLVRARLCMIFKFWESQLLSTKGTVFLPIDFSDEYVGGLEIRRIDTIHYSLQCAYTREVAGYQIDFHKSDFSEFDSIDVIPDRDSVTMIATFEELRTSIRKLQEFMVP